MNVRRYPALALFGLCCLFASSGCGSNGGGTPSDPAGSLDPLKDMPGTYALMPPDAPLSRDGNLTAELTGGTFVVSNNFTHTYSVSFRLTRGTAVTATQWAGKGTWLV